MSNGLNATGGTNVSENFEMENRASAAETSSEDSQGVEAGAEIAPDATAAKPKLKPPEQSDEYVGYFNARVAEGVSPKEAAAEVFAFARELANKLADRAMHRAKDAEDTINGALDRIGATLAEGKENPLFALADIVAEIKRLRDEHGDNLDRITGQSSDNDNDSVESK